MKVEADIVCRYEISSYLVSWLETHLATQKLHSHSCGPTQLEKSCACEVAFCDHLAHPDDVHVPDVLLPLPPSSLYLQQQYNFSPALPSVSTNFNTI